MTDYWTIRIPKVSCRRCVSWFATWSVMLAILVTGGVCGVIWKENAYLIGYLFGCLATIWMNVRSGHGDGAQR